MKVKKVVILCIALLALPLFVPAAGAIYVEGYAPPDDGQMHILAASTGTSVSPGHPFLSGSFTGNIGPSAFPANIALPPSLSMPVFSVSSLNGDIICGNAIGHIAEPAPAGYWDNPGGMELHTNMPTLDVPGIFG